MDGAKHAAQGWRLLPADDMGGKAWSHRVELCSPRQAAQLFNHGLHLVLSHVQYHILQHEHVKSLGRPLPTARI